MDVRKLLLIAFVFSGIAALIYEITWIRPLQFLLGSTTYTISIIFATFMLGLAIGSYVISKYTDKIKNLPKVYALLEIGIGVYCVLLLSIFSLLPKVYNNLYFLHSNFYLFEFVQFVLVFVVLLVPTAFMGATFPVIAKYYTKEKIGKGIGEIYSANNLGAIVGSFAAGFILIPVFGIKWSIIFSALINVTIGIIVLLKVDKVSARKILPLTLVFFVFISVFGNYNIEKMHTGGFYRTHETYENLGPVVYYEEGVYATISVRDLSGQGEALFVNGKGQGSSQITDLRVNYLLAYLPTLINSKIDNTLVIGLGTGTTSGQLSSFSKVKTVEIEPKIVGATDYFRAYNLNVLENPNHELIIDDGRNYLLRNKEKYDLIVQEPSDPWESFSTNLYSKEFFELVKDDLNDDGLFVKWVPIYTMSVEDFRNFYKTFDSVFENNIAFANIKSNENTPVKFETTEILLVGSENKIILDNIESNYESLPDNSKQYLNAIRLNSAQEFMNLILFSSQDLPDYARDAKIVTDDNSLLEFSTARNVLKQSTYEIIKDTQEYENR